MIKANTLRRAMLATGIAFLGAMTAGTPVGAQTAIQTAATAAAPAAVAAVPPSEQKYQAADPALYAIARQYFPSDENAAPSKRIFRLTRDQIDASVASLLPDYFSQSIKEAMPRDSLQTNYEFAELLSFNGANIRPLSAWIGAIAARVRTNPAGVINCAAANAAPDCLKAEARKFIVKAFRGDVTDVKIGQMTEFFLKGVQGAGLNQAASELVEVVLSSPDFLFRKELEVNKSNRLAPAQLLQALTYTIADVPPEKLRLDSQLANRYLQTGLDASATIRAIVESPQSREKLARFFTAWLEIKGPGEFTISPQVYPEFNAQLGAAMRSETNRFLRTQLSKTNPKLKDITQATQSFIPKTLEPIYGTSAATSSGGAMTQLDPAQRLGIFSHPAVLASHSGPTNTRPIKRGVFWVRKVMCMELEPPPPDLHAKLYELEGATERQRIEASTSQPACAGCHKVINPFAFFQESYDALGKWRTLDNGAPIDTSILIDFLDEDAAKTVTSVDALRTLTNSAMFKQCFVRQLFRFYMGRKEEASDDPLLRRMFFEFARDDEQDIFRSIQVMTSSDRIVKRQ